MGTWGTSVHPICLAVFWGASVHLLGILISVGTSICSSVHISHTSCSPSLLVASLLNWMPMDVCYVSYCCSFLCSIFIMSQVSNTTATTTTPPVTIVCSSTSSLSVVTMAPSLMGLQGTSGQYDVALPPLLTPRHSGSVVGLATVLQLQLQPPSQLPLQAYANYAMGPPQVGFSFRVECPSFVFLYVWYLIWCMLSDFRCHAGDTSLFPEVTIALYQNM